MIYKTEKHADLYGEDVKLFVTMRLHDDCNNGHYDFAITGDIYAAPTYRRWIAGGCVHRYIEQVFPELAMFIPFHNRSDKGIPTYPLINGKYFLINEPEYAKKHFWLQDEDAGDMILQALRIAAVNIKTLHEVCKEVGIYDMWERKASNLIKEFEKLTGVKYERNLNQIDQIKKDLRCYKDKC